jgi:hypothetical protein
LFIECSSFFLYFVICHWNPSESKKDVFEGFPKRCFFPFFQNGIFLFLFFNKEWTY